MVQSAQVPDQFISGPNMQMVGVGQLHLTVGRFQVLRIHSAFDGRLSSDIHKYRSLDGAVHGFEASAAGFSLFFE
ncbi:hypothetical protein SDC9_181966 [bioreactor metagenome]|uniref:Uncharacterized protein n=1 Tax=bioreactor metagenome TaxID=1076179 RepID=A0A645H7X6_9ZZZZ